jgi:hypothetical protein
VGRNPLSIKDATTELMDSMFTSEFSETKIKILHSKYITSTLAQELTNSFEGNVSEKLKVCQLVKKFQPCIQHEGSLS